MKIILYGSILIGILNMQGCANKNPFVEQKKATNKNLKVGYINKNAPIIRAKKSEPIFIPQKFSQQEQKKVDTTPQENKIEMVGYIIFSDKDKNVRLYYYTIINALKTKRIQFFSKNPIRYNPNKLVKIKVVDNYLVDYQPYKAILKRRRFNNKITPPKEYYINFR